MQFNELSLLSQIIIGFPLALAFILITLATIKMIAEIIKDMFS